MKHLAFLIWFLLFTAAEAGVRYAWGSGDPEFASKYLLTGKATCIDCHKGIAHELPNMEGIDPGWKMPPALDGHPGQTASAIDDLRRAMSDVHRNVF